MDGEDDDRLIEFGEEDSLSSLSKVTASVSEGQDMVIDNGVDLSLLLFMGNAVNDDTAGELDPWTPP